MDIFFTDSFDVFYNTFKDIIPMNKDIYESYCEFIHGYIRE